MDKGTFRLCKWQQSFWVVEKRGPSFSIFYFLFFTLEELFSSKTEVKNKNGVRASKEARVERLSP